jgi:predicted MFS family arabinose efflux permease
MEDSKQTQDSNRRLIIVYIIVVFLYWCALYFYVPTLSVYAETKVSDLSLVGVMLSMYGLWQAVTRFPLGLAADWVGRRKLFILVGFALAGLGAILMGVSPGIGGLIAGRALTGFAASVWVLLVVSFSSLYPPAEAVRASAMLSAVSAVARMIVTSSTGALNDLAGYSLAFFMAAGAAFLAIVVMLGIREKRRSPKQPSFTYVAKLITRRDVLLPSLLCAVLQYAIWSSTFGFSPNLARTLGASDVALGLLTSMNIGVILLGNFFTTTASKRLGAYRLVVIAFLLVFSGLGLLFLSQKLWMVFAGQICMGLASGVGYPVLMGMSIRHVDDSQRATAMGLFQAVYAIGMFAGPWLSGILAETIGLQPMFGLVGLICSAVGLFGSTRIARNTESATQAVEVSKT